MLNYSTINNELLWTPNKSLWSVAMEILKLENCADLFKNLKKPQFRNIKVKNRSAIFKIFVAALISLFLMLDYSTINNETTLNNYSKFGVRCYGNIKE